MQENEKKKHIYNLKIMQANRIQSKTHKLVVALIFFFFLKIYIKIDVDNNSIKIDFIIDRLHACMYS